MLTKDYIDVAEKINGLEASRKYDYILVVGLLVDFAVCFLMGV